MRRLRAPLPVFLIVSFGVTWLLWLPLLLNAQTGSALSVMPYQFFLASFGQYLSRVQMHESPRSCRYHLWRSLVGSASSNRCMLTAIFG